MMFSAAFTALVAATAVSAGPLQARQGSGNANVKDLCYELKPGSNQCGIVSTYDHNPIIPDSQRYANFMSAGCDSVDEEYWEGRGGNNGFEVELKTPSGRTVYARASSVGAIDGVSDHEVWIDDDKLSSVECKGPSSDSSGPSVTYYNVCRFNC